MSSSYLLKVSVDLLSANILCCIPEVNLLIKVTMEQRAEFTSLARLPEVYPFTVFIWLRSFTVDY